MSVESGTWREESGGLFFGMRRSGRDCWTSNYLTYVNFVVGVDGRKSFEHHSGCECFLSALRGRHSLMDTKITQIRPIVVAFVDLTTPRDVDSCQNRRQIGNFLFKSLGVT